jgi:hypothetical protein
MNFRDAKREACWTAAGLLERYLSEGGVLRNSDGVERFADYQR